ncbi:uncharacterized protein LOC124354915 [Homalodisca vitripennis]|uniref:uncharacterized protein LOC124354915 n=1 Tax=Homalodisca vitripennis TaxID=197043 RepID=UPI001EEAD5A6|nr:uncharacterized protein LOC124354915 [Homalodisca vitripennis]KAG8338188.1 hypothetical protein J6590_005729 [Homalodisca vitripennis]
MKRAASEDKKCRRMEFKCKLYDVIKDLEKSLNSECDMSSKRQYGRSGGVKEQQMLKDKYQEKGSECCCPPGCCKESLKVKPPKMSLKGRGYEQGGAQEHNQRHDAMGHLPWHEEDHNNGCWPDYTANQGQKGHSASQCSQFPSTPEEMARRGCFFAGAA